MLEGLQGIKDYQGAAYLLALFIIWKLIEEIIRFKGRKNYKKVNGQNPGNHCKWTTDDHHWLMEMRDHIKDNKNIMRKLNKYLDRELNK